jgi:hypothetical protein
VNKQDKSGVKEKELVEMYMEILFFFFLSFLPDGMGWDGMVTLRHAT